VAGIVLATTLVVCPAIASAQDEEKVAPPPPNGSGTIALRDVVRMTVKASPDDKAAVARIAHADAESDIVSSGYLPKLDAGVRGGASTERGSFLFRRDQYVVNSLNAEARAGVHWTVYDFGRTSAASSAADAARTAAER